MGRGCLIHQVQETLGASLRQTGAYMRSSLRDAQKAPVTDVPGAAATHEISFGQAYAGNFFLHVSII